MKHFLVFTKFLILIFFFLSSKYSHAQSKSGLHLIKKTTIGGNGFWDYVSVDSQSRHLYLSHSNQVEVLNADTHKKIGVITETKGVHGVIEIPGMGKGFTTNGKTNTSTIFDTKTFKKIAELPTGDIPDALLYDAFSGYVFIFNNEGGSATVIDSKTNKVVKTIELGGAPEAGVTNEKGLIFVNLEDKNEIVAFDSKDFSIKHRFKLAPGEEPTGLAIDLVKNILFSGCHNQLLIVVDASNGNILAKLPIGKGVDGVVYDPKSKLVICSNGEGTITLIKEKSANEFAVLETIPTHPGARTIGIDAKTNHIFLPAGKAGPAPAPTKENPKPWPSILPNTFMVLEFGI